MQAWDMTELEISDKIISLSVHLRDKIKILVEDVGRLTLIIKDLENVRDSASELLEVAKLRGDNELPCPPDDPKQWSARMQEAWYNLAIAISENDNKNK